MWSKLPPAHSGSSPAPTPADPAEVEAGVDAFAAEPRPGGVVAVGRRRPDPFGAATDRLAVTDRDREEEVAAFAAVEHVGAVVVE